MTAPRSMSDERRIPDGVAATYVTFAPSRLRTLRRAYLPLTPDARAPSQTAGIHPTELLYAPLVQAVAQTIRLDSERLADRFEGERPVTVSVQNPLFGLAEPCGARLCSGRTTPAHFARGLSLPSATRSSLFNVVVQRRTFMGARTVPKCGEIAASDSASTLCV